MPDNPEKIVINTGPLIALVAAMGDLKLLNDLYTRVLVPYEVCQEITVENTTRFAAKEFQAAGQVEKCEHAVSPPPLLKKLLDPGEGGVFN